MLTNYRYVFLIASNIQKCLDGPTFILQPCYYCALTLLMIFITYSECISTKSNILSDSYHHSYTKTVHTSRKNGKKTMVLLKIVLKPTLKILDVIAPRQYLSLQEIGEAVDLINTLYTNPHIDFRNCKNHTDLLFILFTSSNFLHSGLY